MHIDFLQALLHTGRNSTDSYNGNVCNGAHVESYITS